MGSKVPPKIATFNCGYFLRDVTML